jgi:hypothetical protein
MNHRYVIKLKNNLAVLGQDDMIKGARNWHNPNSLIEECTRENGLGSMINPRMMIQ